MPQLFVVALLGAGLYAGYRWLTKEVGRATDAARRAQDELARRAAGAPKDLGALVWDESAKVYRPKGDAA